MSKTAKLFPEDALAEFCRRYQVRELALFGSVARDEESTDSDLDLLVEFKPDARVGFLVMGRMSRELAHMAGREVDLVPKGGLKPAIRDHVLEEAEVLFAE
jgi:predicted nucleotidyltransferase